MSTAEILQEHENRGHRWASALLVHANEPSNVVRAVLTRAFYRSESTVKSAVAWRMRAVHDGLKVCAFMAGVELAIEQQEAEQCQI